MRYASPYFGNNLVDANILDSIADGQDDAVNEIVELAEADEITLLLPHSVRAELDHPSTPVHVKRAAQIFLFSLCVNLTPAELLGRQRFIDAVRGNATDKNILRDLQHVFDAARNGGRYFITRDKPLLARAAIIATKLDICVVTPNTFMQQLRSFKKPTQKQ